MPFGTTCLSTSASCAWRMSRVPCGPLMRLSTTGGGRREARLRGKTEATNLRDTHLYLQPSILQARKHITRTSSQAHANMRHLHPHTHPLGLAWATARTIQVVAFNFRPYNFFLLLLVVISDLLGCCKSLHPTFLLSLLPKTANLS